MGYDKQRFLNMLAMGMCSKGRMGKKLPPTVYLAASQWNTAGPGLEDCLTFSSAEPFTIATYNSTKNWDGSLYYSSDLAGWAEWDGTTAISSAQHGNGQKIYIYGCGNSVITGNYFNKRWVLNGTNIECSGNIENLLDYETVKAGKHPAMADCCYAHLFHNCASLVTAPELPAITLTYMCYYHMFYHCTSLVTAPELPATTLAKDCYRNMFQGCESLTTAPELPATTLAEWCYASMFIFCSNLTAAPKLPATTLAPGCYRAMFNGCTSLVTAPELPVTTLAEECYWSMFGGCTNLTAAPKLPATTLAPECYQEMFASCKSLVTVPELPATTLATSCYQQMFSNCHNINTLPALPATTLAEKCYYAMFQQCYNIKLSATQTDEYQTPYRIPANGTGTTATDALLSMFLHAGGTFTGTPSLNTTYYTSNTVV